MKKLKFGLRVTDQGYFVLMGQIVEIARSSADKDKTWVVPRGNPFPIRNGVQPIRAPATGELVLFVNDVVCPLCPSGTFTFYANNKGRTVISVDER